MSPFKTNFVITLGFCRDIILFILVVCIGTVSKWNVWQTSQSNVLLSFSRPKLSGWGFIRISHVGDHLEYI
jgi:hypothetical protein